MKLGSISKMLAGTVLALCFVGSAVAAPTPWTGAAEKQDQPQTKYPNTTRKAPKLDLRKQSDADKINEGTTAVSEGKFDEAREILTPFAEGKASRSKYAQVIALQGLANINYQQQKYDAAITNLKKALAIGVMPNDTYFGLMYEMAQMYASAGKSQQAVDTIEKWRQEGKRETADSYGLEGIMEYQLGHYKKAIAAIQKAKTLTDKPKANWTQVLAASYAETGQAGQGIAMAKQALAANPNDATTRHNLISLLIQADKYPEALKVMEDARSKGELTTADSYVNLAKLYLMAGQNAATDVDPRTYADKALAVVKEGFAKKILKPDFETYKLQADANLIGGYSDAALKSYTEAAKYGTDGSADLMRAQLLGQDNKYSAARAAARDALKKGTSHKGRAYMIIAKSERAMKHKAAAVKAMKKAAQDPETKARAEDWLKKSGY